MAALWEALMTTFRRKPKPQPVTPKPAAGTAKATVHTTGTIWIEPMPWLQAGVMQGDMR